MTELFSLYTQAFDVIAQTGSGGGGAPAQPPPAGSLLGGLLPFILLLAAMWFLIIAPQRKKQKEHAKMVSELKSGDDVLTAGGIYGTITNVKDDRFVVKVADSTKIEVTKSSVQQRAGEDSAAAGSESKSETDK